MSFLEIFAYNIYASFFGVVTASCVGVAVLKSMHPGRRICRPGKIFFTAVYIVVLAFAATLSYKMGLLKMTASEVLLSYVTLMGNAVCISRFFEDQYGKEEYWMFSVAAICDMPVIMRQGKRRGQIQL